VSDQLEAPKLCFLLGWRLERVAGEHPGYLLCLLCDDQHVHFVAHTPLLPEAYRLARAWERDTFGEAHPGLPIQKMWHTKDEDREEAAVQDPHITP
jgi:hypothetical protein